MTEDEFLARCKRLSHVAPPGAWDVIRRHGLRTAEQLINQAELDSRLRQQLLTTVRSTAVPLKVGGDSLILRDQGPLLARKDLSALLGDGMSVEDWVRILNKRVYLFVDLIARDNLLKKYVAAQGAQDLIVFSPYRLWQTAKNRLELAAQNTGAIARKSGPYKFKNTFLPVSRFPNKTPTEVTIVDGLDDLAPVVAVTRVYSDGRTERLPL